MSSSDETENCQAAWPIFVISLKDAVARRSKVSVLLRDLGLDFEFFDAIDGRGGVPPEYESDIDRPGTSKYFGRPMSDGEYACALSHLAIYRRILADDLPGAVVLEDDAIVGDGFVEFLRERGYVHAPLIQLDHRSARTPRVGAISIKFGACTLWQLAQNAFLTTGYTISRAGAEFILSNAVPLRSPADWPCDLRPICPLCAIPRLVDHPKDGMDLSTLSVARDSLVEARKRSGGKRWKYLTNAYWKKKWLKFTTRRLS